MAHFEYCLNRCFLCPKKLYKLSKLGGGGWVIWTNPEEQQFFSLVRASLSFSHTGVNLLK